jgi:hypothetical protein
MMVAVSTSPFNLSMLRKANIWYSVKDGNYNDPTVWVSNGRKRYNYPQVGDTVYINHIVLLNISSAVNNIYVAGKLTAANTGLTLTVNGDFQASGTVDLTGSNVTINLGGYNNFIAFFTAGASSTIGYTSLYTQAVMPLTYQNLTLTGILTGGQSGTSLKYLQANLSVLGALVFGCTIDTKGYNLSVSGVTQAACANATIISSNNILFTGQFQASAGRTSIIVGNPTIECRGGLLFNNAASNWTGANLNFTTNNQSITNELGGNTVNNITITGAITVNNSPSLDAFTRTLTVTGVINGTVSGSVFNNNGLITLTNSTLPMVTGVFNYRNTAGSTITYAIPGNYTLPYTGYDNLGIDGGGIKSITGNLTINYSLAIASGSLELSTYNLTVIGTTSLTPGYITKSGAGAIIFAGLVTLSLGSTSSAFTGNPTVEFRGGLSAGNGTMDLGAGGVSFTTNNQNLFVQVNTLIINSNVMIGAGITVTILPTTFGGVTTIMNGYINGADSSSTLINTGDLTYDNAQQPMQTGIFSCNTAVNKVTYGLAGNQDITPGIYRNLTLNNSGAKKLLGNVSVVNTYTLTSPATLNSNGFSLTNP